MIAAVITVMRGRWHWLALAVMAIAVAGLAKSRASWKNEAQALEAWQYVVRDAASIAAGVEGTLKADQVIGQIHLLGASLRECKGAVQVQNAAVIATAREGEAMRRQSESAAAAVRKSEASNAALAERLAKAKPPAAPTACATPGEVMEVVR